MKKERRTAGDRRTETTSSSGEARGATGRKKEKKRGAIKSWGRREKLDMGLCAVLLICLSQAELGRVWAEENEGKTLTYAQVSPCKAATSLLSETQN